MNGDNLLREYHEVFYLMYGDEVVRGETSK